jgi:chromate transport protein ChrA
VHRFKRWIGVAILVVAAIVLFTWTYPTTMVVVWTTVIVLVGFAIREFLDTGSAPPVTGSRTTAAS